jgi:hypothetical protein
MEYMLMAYMGRRTYEEFAKLWPAQPSTVPIAKRSLSFPQAASGA